MKISLQSIPKGPIYNTPALVQIIAWRQRGGKPLFGPMMFEFTDVYMRHSVSSS